MEPPGADTCHLNFLTLLVLPGKQRPLHLISSVRKKNKTKQKSPFITGLTTGKLAQWLPRSLALESCLGPAEEESSSNPTKVACLPGESLSARRHLQCSGWLRGSGDLQASQGRKALGPLENRGILLGSLDNGSYELRLLWIIHMFENTVRSSNV